LASLFSTLLVAQPDKHGAVLGLVQDEPALRAGAASGILDKTCARRSARGRSAPRNGPLSLTKECNLDLESGEATSEAMVTSQHGQFRTSLDMADISNWSRPKRWFGKYMYLWRAVDHEGELLEIHADGTNAQPSSSCASCSASRVSRRRR